MSDLTSTVDMYSSAYGEQDGRPSDERAGPIQTDLLLSPLIGGTGRPSDLLFGAAPAVGFSLTDTTTLSDGIVILSHQTDKILGEAA